jgi:hypothetical protein
MLFHHRQTQACLIGDLLVATPFAYKSRNFLFAPRESDQMRQTEAHRPGTPTAQIFALDQKMRQGHTD